MARNARATKEMLKERCDTLIDFLGSGPKSTQEIAELLELSYPQTTLLLQKMEKEQKIERLPGRQARKLFYSLSNGLRKSHAEHQTPIVDRDGTEIHLVKIDNKLFVSWDSMVQFAESTPHDILYKELYLKLEEEGII